MSSLREGPFIHLKKREAPSNPRPARTVPANEVWTWDVQGPSEDAEIFDRDPRVGTSSGSQIADTDPNQPQDTNPRTAGKERADCDKDEEQPLYKVALMTATAENLGVGIGEGLAQAAPAAEDYEDTPGFRLLVKGMALRMNRKVASTTRVKRRMTT